jgi:SAM-dependent methyltransferase
LVISRLHETASWYDKKTADLAAAYKAIDRALVHAWLDTMLRSAPALVLDVGAGTGRDAGVRRVGNFLPALPATHRHRRGLTIDLILLSGVWLHVPPGERERALRRLLGRLRPDGVLALTLRHRPAAAERAMHPVSLVEVKRLARDHGAMVARVAEMPDRMARAEVSGTGVVLRLPPPARCRCFGRQSRGLSADDSARVAAKAVIIEEVERLHWRLWNGKAKDAQISIDLIRAVMHHFQREQGVRKSIAASRKSWTALHALGGYLTGQSESGWIINCAERHRAGLRVGSAITERTANFLVNRQ